MKEEENMPDKGWGNPTDQEISFEQAEARLLAEARNLRGGFIRMVRRLNFSSMTLGDLDATCLTSKYGFGLTILGNTPVVLRKKPTKEKNDGRLCN